ncbi:sialate O-acetylesterase-like [Ostrea edulis]|uniref:sialate O-acetylesterase-like n=1 Tax=Ostrea edulis TaxID=37623 RepID=UPI0024AF49DE|nr:sialate O-acetylesterase-like [Ostrea edulis]
MGMFFKLVLFHLAVKAVLAVPGKLSFASYFNDGMVLQKSPQSAQVWGYCSQPGQNVTVTISGQQPVRAFAVDYPNVQGGVWTARLAPQNGPGPVTIEATDGQNKISLSDVLFGDVWICSGQSNMEFTLDMALNASYELADTTKYQSVRVFTATKRTSSKPELDLLQIDEQWSKPTKDTLGHKPWTYFSAVCWLYGKYIYQKLNYPVGLVASSWGGTAIELWSSPDALKQCNIPQKSERQKKGISNSQLWNAMMNPFTKMTVKGAVWYQGEANAGKPDTYKCTFPTMIDDWRAKFHASSGTTSDFPFGFVQLAPFRDDPSITTGFPDIRWHQTADVGYVPNYRMKNVFMSVAMDLPDYKSPYGSIHPQDKQDVSRRLALSGLSVAYNMSLGPFQGPQIAAFYVDIGFFTVGFGFDNAVEIEVRNKAGFEVCCSVNNQSRCDGTDSVWMETPIVKEKPHLITVSYNGTCSNKYVMGYRYAWRESPCPFKMCALYVKGTNIPFGPIFGLGLLNSKRSKLTENRIPIFVKGIK